MGRTTNTVWRQLDELEAWFTAPGFNVGIVTGKLSGIYVIDVDRRGRRVDAAESPAM